MRHTSTPRRCFTVLSHYSTSEALLAPSAGSTRGWVRSCRFYETHQTRSLRARTAHPMALPATLALGPPRSSRWSSDMAVSSCSKRPRAVICISQSAVALGEVAHGALSALLLAATAVPCGTNTSSATMSRLPLRLVRVARRHLHLLHRHRARQERMLRHASCMIVCARRVAGGFT